MCPLFLMTVLIGVSRFSMKQLPLKSVPSRKGVSILI